MSDRTGAGPAARNGAVAVLALHGFTGKPASMEPIGNALRAVGYEVELPLLPGHGTTPADLAETTFDDWLGAADAAYVELAGRSARVIVAGISMGGALSLSLALRHPEIAGLILVNPVAEPPAPSFVAMMRAALAAGTVSIPSIGADIAKPGVPQSGYDETPIAPMLSLFDGIDALTGRLSEISCPTLLFSSRTDHVVPPSNGDLLAAELGGPVERVMLESSFHVATLDNDAPLVVATSVAFVEKIGAAR